MLVLLPTPSALATNSVGGACKKVGSLSKSGSTALICAKVGKKTIWKKVLRTQTPAPQASASATPSASASPSSNPVATIKSSGDVKIDVASWSYSFVYSLDDKSKRTSEVLYIPQGKILHFTLTNSADTSHGFWIPGLALDKEAVPGESAHFDFTADKLGSFPGLCNILCGRGHAGMAFTAQVVSEEEFLKKLSTMSR